MKSACIYIFSFLLIFPALSNAQELLVSAAIKNYSNYGGHEIIGRSNENVLVAYQGRKNPYMSSYRLKDLEINWEKEIEIDAKNADILDVFMTKDTVYVFAGEREVKAFNLVAYLFSPHDLSLLHKQEIMTEVRYFTENKVPFGVEHSKNRKHILAYKFDQRDPDSLKLTYVVLGRGLNEEHGQYRSYSKDYIRPFKNMLVGNKGHAAIMFNILQTKSLVKKSPTIGFEGEIFKFNGGGNTFTYTSDKYDFYDIEAGFDQKSSFFNVSGLFDALNSRQDMRGVFSYKIINENEEEPISKIKFNEFTETEINEINDSLKNKRYKRNGELDRYSLMELKQRSDGGSLAILESYYQKEDVDYFDRRDPYGGAFNAGRRQIYHYYSILMVSMDKTGELEWYKPIDKRQISMDDEGLHSSFGFLNLKNELVLLFNEDITFDSNLISYSSNIKGEVERKDVVNNKAKDIFLVPRKGKQLESNSFIMPSYKRNEFRLVKLIY